MSTATATDTTYALGQYISTRLGICPEEAYTLAEELIENGIETAEKFDDSFRGEFDEWNNEADFAFELMFALGVINADSPLLGHIDWNSVWDNQLRYEYFHIDTYFFKNA